MSYRKMKRIYEMGAESERKGEWQAGKNGRSYSIKKESRQKG